MEQLRQKYEGRGVEFVAMYVREPHPGETGFRSYRQHESFEHKMGYARELVNLKDMKIPLMVDGFDGVFHEMLGQLPNYVYVVNRSGLVEYKATWLWADHVDEVLAEMVTKDDPSRPIEVTVDTSSLGPSI